MSTRLTEAELARLEKLAKRHEFVLVRRDKIDPLIAAARRAAVLERVVEYARHRDDCPASGNFHADSAKVIGPCACGLGNALAALARAEAAYIVRNTADGGGRVG